MGTAREISEEPKGRAGARSHAFPLPEPGLILPELRDTGAESRGTRPLPGTWKLPGAFPAVGGDGTLWSR